jgi:hypothetical protein
MIVIIVTSEESEPQTYQLDSDHIRIGRSSDNDLILPNRTCSRHHAEIVKEGDLYRIIDLGSTNGVKIGEERVQETELGHGSFVGIGHYTLTISLPDQVSAETVAVPLANIQQGIAASDSETDESGQITRTHRLDIRAVSQEGEQSRRAWVRVAVFLVASALIVLAVMVGLRYLTGRQIQTPPVLHATAVRVAPVQIDNGGELVAPQEALDNLMNGQADVFVVRDLVAYKVHISVGQRLGQGIEVLEGLSEGDLLIIDGPDSLTDGQDVQIAR